MNVDANRSSGAGAGNVSIPVNTITIAETTLGEYASGDQKRIVLTVRPGFQLDPTSNVTALSTTIGFNGAAVNNAALLTPSGAAGEVLTFNLTSGTSAVQQDIIRINGIKLRIASALGAAGPAQTTMEVDTTAAGGAFTRQGIVAANLTKGAADRLVFATQPGSVQAGTDLLPSVSIVDFGGNLISDDPRTITLAIEANPGSAALLGTSQRATANGVADWSDADELRITTAAAGYTLRASHDGAAFLTSDSVESGPFDISAGDPGQLAITLQPVDTAAGGDILVDVTAKDEFGNVISGNEVDVTLDAVTNPGGWPLLVDTSLTKATVNGVASWTADDHLRINKQVADYQLTASGLGIPVVSDPFDITPAAPDHLVVAQQPVDTTAGADLLISFTSKDRFNNTVSDPAVSVTLELGVNPGGASLQAASSLTKQTVEGTATWNADDDLRITTAAAGYRIAASSNGTIVQTEAFEIFAGPARALRFLQQPTDSEVDTPISPAVQVAVEDEFGNRTDAAVPVTLELLATPCTGNASNTQATSVAGIASFDNLSIDKACDGYVLGAASSRLSSDTSEPFAVTGRPAAPVLFCGATSAATLLPLLAGLALMRRSRGADARP